MRPVATYIGEVECEMCMGTSSLEILTHGPQIISMGPISVHMSREYNSREVATYENHPNPATMKRYHCDGRR